MSILAALRAAPVGVKKPEGVPGKIVADEAVTELQERPTNAKDARVHLRIDKEGKVASAIVVTGGILVQDDVYRELVAELGEPTMRDDDPIAIRCRLPLPRKYVPRLKAINAVWQTKDGFVLFIGGDFSAGIVMRAAPEPDPLEAEILDHIERR